MSMTKCAYVSLSSYDLHTIPYNEKPGWDCLIPWDATIYCLIAAFHAVAVWAALEMTLQVFTTFRRRNTLYFWSLLACSWGTIGLTVSFDLKLFALTKSIYWAFLTAPTWVAMTTGFSFILYSRLHLITTNITLLRTVFWIIIVDGFLFHTPVIVSEFLIGPFGTKFYEYASYCEIAFVVQEFAISSLYLFLFRKFHHDEPIVKGRTLSTFLLLILAEMIVLLCDILMLVGLYAHYYVPRMMIQTFTYALKARIEFLVLNRLAQRGSRSSITPNIETESDEDGSRKTTQSTSSWGSRFASRSTSEQKSGASTRSLSIQKGVMAESKAPITDLPLFLCYDAEPRLKSTGSVAGHAKSHDGDSLQSLERLYLGNFGSDATV
ncbi:hypothetical protein NA57DRAFT_78396 [Rhizodiscina lignyota]|uniref:DUF7703 domain-containing protein n=1 Tax=Rhizodiscina lignyota TaxID=1504668 RepID=A0A9P4M8G8_9PEZI|nr:hypothetical protein NA57DRAFT_78396 [Rhizodiscina lignyota]